MPLPDVKYAIYPGTTPVYDENGDYIEDQTFTALELATLYGVQDEPYLTVPEAGFEPQGETYFEYIHLKPRKDGKYINMLNQVEDVYRPDFDAKKKYTEETDPRAIDPEVENDLEDNQRNGDFK